MYKASAYINQNQNRPWTQQSGKNMEKKQKTSLVKELSVNKRTRKKVKKQINKKSNKKRVRKRKQ